jgi:hypothetical protein
VRSIEETSVNDNGGAVALSQDAVLASVRRHVANAQLRAAASAQRSISKLREPAVVDGHARAVSRVDGRAGKNILITGTVPRDATQVEARAARSNDRSDRGLPIESHHSIGSTRKMTRGDADLGTLGLPRIVV